MAVSYFFNIFYACIKPPSRFFSRDGGFLFAIIPHYPLKFKGIMGYNRCAPGMGNNSVVKVHYALGSRKR